MTEITTYECDFCGEVFDDEQECIHHEWKCRYSDMCRTENCEPLKLFNLDGYEIKGFDYPECDEIGAVEVHSYAWAQFIDDYFEEMGYEKPILICEGIVQYGYGLYYYDSEYRYGEWRYYPDILDKVKRIGEKFGYRG